MTVAPAGIEAVLFDVDDTLVDTRGVWERALDTLCRNIVASVPGSDAEALADAYRVTSDALWGDYARALAPLGSVPAIRRHVWQRTLRARGVEVSSDRLGWIVAEFDALQRAEIRPDPQLPGLLSLLAERYRLAVCSNGEGEQTRMKLERAGVLQYFESVVCGIDEQVRKPDPELFARCCRSLGVQAERCLYIGDDWSNDVDAARRAGLRPLWIPTDPAALVPDGQRPPPRYRTVQACLRDLLRATDERSTPDRLRADRLLQKEIL
ncbi:HAD family hydrolase [Streptomyces sp. NBC_01275]|uniref:HAD family hydrolase n=1 Tax=Streptomyces sp. NBC_01275 TaxID=2903807 RepID=UPI00224F6411|nr:HAD family hydrolase [Streptomyces sp. NBC_01275]MCX4763632.1 HAD family hydrolase [Streptomyces sp. NBC_01275]